MFSSNPPPRNPPNVPSSHNLILLAQQKRKLQRQPGNGNNGIQTQAQEKGSDMIGIAPGQLDDQLDFSPVKEDTSSNFTAKAASDDNWRPRQIPQPSQPSPYLRKPFPGSPGMNNRQFFSKDDSDISDRRPQQYETIKQSPFAPPKDDVLHLESIDENMYFYDEDGGHDGEDVMLARDIRAKQKVSDNYRELEFNFRLLSTQMEEFRNKITLNGDNHTEGKKMLSSLNQQIVDLEEENTVLKQKLIDSMQNRQADNRPANSAMHAINQRRYNRVTFDESNTEHHKELQRVLHVFDDIDDSYIAEDRAKKHVNLAEFIRSISYGWKPFQSDIFKVKSKLGSSVASYFMFERYLLLQYCALLVFVFPFTINHIITIFYRKSHYSLTDFIAREIYVFKGIQPLFLSYSSYKSDEGLLFVWCVLITTLTCLFFAVIKFIHEDRMSKIIESFESMNSYTFSSEIFNSWDFSATRSKEDCKNYASQLKHTFRQLIYDYNIDTMKARRSRSAQLLLNLRRCIGMFVYVVYQFASLVLILYITIYSQSIIRFFQNNVNSNNRLSSFLPSATLMIINSLTPTVVKAITTFEHWDYGNTEINMLLVRYYVSQISNLSIIVLSYLLLANPFFLATDSTVWWRNRFGVTYQSTDFDCRLDQASNGLHVLAMTSFATQILTVFGNGYVYNKFCSYFNLSWKKIEIDIALSIINILNTISTFHVAFPYSPCILVFLPVFLYFRMKHEVYAYIHYYDKPTKPWKLQKSIQIFFMFYVISLAIFGLMTCLVFINVKTYEKSCSIQDIYVDLCVNNDISFSNGIASCTQINTYSGYYGVYGHGTGAEVYPNLFCSTSCGPFNHQSSPFSLLKTFCNSNTFSRVLFEIVFNTSYLPWFLVIFIVISLLVRMNSFNVAISSYQHIVNVLQQKITYLHTKNKNKDKIIERFQIIDITNTRDGDGESMRYGGPNAKKYG